jgi:uncharacterized protein with PIN domain
MIEVTVRVYGPLNDFLPPGLRQTGFSRTVDGHPSVKDLIESIGVPHPEIELILVNGEPVTFDYLVQDADRVAVFPRFTTLEVDSLSPVRPRPPEAARFVTDVHLGKLTRRLRLLGLDTASPEGADDAMVAELAERDERIVLTRDQALLKRRRIAHGYFVRERDAPAQLVEVLRRFGPLALRPFSRCLRCNGVLHDVPKSAIASKLPRRTSEQHDQFAMCSDCGKIYWKGSHWPRLQQLIDTAREAAG